MATFQKGKPKTGGRQKGSLNKNTRETRELISQLTKDNFEKFQDDLNQLEPKERLEILVKLLPYSIPKLQNIELTGDVVTGVIDVPLRPEEQEQLSETLKQIASGK